VDSLFVSSCRQVRGHAALVAYHRKHYLRGDNRIKKDVDTLAIEFVRDNTVRIPRRLA
jgi:hypothetical protein